MWKWRKGDSGIRMIERMHATENEQREAWVWYRQMDKKITEWKTEFSKSSEVIFCRAPLSASWSVLSHPSRGCREGWETCVQSSRNLREVESNENQEGLLNACKCSSCQSTSPYPERSGEKTCASPLEFLLGQVLENPARNGSSLEPSAREEPCRACISTS